jgi:hypothetical protein
MTERIIYFIKKGSAFLQTLLCILIFIFPITGLPICSFATESGQRPIEPADAYDRLSDAFMAVPEPNPPRIEEADRTSPGLLGNATPRSTAIMVEWTYHKTMDNEHPDDIEQQLLWLTNRARANPSQEGQWLATFDDPYIDMARSYFGVDIALLQDEFASYAVKPPAAFDVRLYNAAKAQSEDLIQRDAQDHNQQFDHIDAAGFVYSQVRGIVFSYAYTALYGHAAFNIDWGVGDGTGMQPGRGHRMAIMSVDGNYTNVGVAVIKEHEPSTGVGPLVIAGNYCRAYPNEPDHYNRFIVGTVWSDSNGNGQFDPEEGIGGVTVMPDGGTFYAVTSNSGGYAIPILVQGEFVVTFSGSSLVDDIVQPVTVGSDSVLVDCIVDQEVFKPEVNTGPASVLSSASVKLTGLVNPNDHRAVYYFEYGSIPDLEYVTNDHVVQEDSTIAINVKGLDPETTYYYRIVAANSVGTSYGRTALFYNTYSEPEMPQTPSGGGSGGGCYITAITGCSAAIYGSCHLIILFAVPFSVLTGRFLWNYIKPAV